MYTLIYTLIYTLMFIHTRKYTLIYTAHPHSGGGALRRTSVPITGATHEIRPFALIFHRKERVGRGSLPQVSPRAFACSRGTLSNYGDMRPTCLVGPSCLGRTRSRGKTAKNISTHMHFFAALFPTSHFCDPIKFFTFVRLCQCFRASMCQCVAVLLLPIPGLRA